MEDDRGPLRRSSGRALAAALLAAASLAVPGPVAAVPELLETGSVVVRELAPDGTITFTAALVPRRAYGLSVEQRGVDVEVVVTAPDGAEVAVDNPFDRAGWEEALIEPAAGQGGTWTIAVRAREAGAPGGEVAVGIAAVGASGGEEGLEKASGKEEIEAWRAVTSAGAAYRAGGREGRERALAGQRAAHAAWKELGRRREAATALYAAAVLARLIDRPEEALGAAREVLGLWRELGEGRWAAATENEIGLDLWLTRDPAQLDEARAAFERAAAAFAALGDSYGEGSARANLCLLEASGGALAAGLACYDRALPLLEKAGAPGLAAAALANVGRAHDLLGDPEAAATAYDRALNQARAAGEEGTAARALNNLAVLHQRMGELDAAVVAHARALDSFRRLGDRRWQALSLHNLGLLYLRLGDLDQADGHAAEALALWQSLGEPGGEAAALTTRGLAERQRGDPAAARALLARAVELRVQGPDRRAEGEALTQLALTDLAAGDLPAARQGFEAALSRLAGKDPIAEGDARRGLAQALLAAGDPNSARAELQTVLQAMRVRGYRVGEGQALYQLARTERAAGRLAEALALAAQAAAISESLRGAGGPDLRATAAEVRHPVHELQVDLLLAAHQREPAAGHDRRALEASERARARTLRELLAEARIEPRDETGPTAALLARKRSLERQLAAHLERTWRGTSPAAQARGARDGAAADRTPSESQVPGPLLEEQALLAELDRVESELRTANPSYAALSPAAPLGEARIRALLDPDTLLLVYALGDERSVLWRVSPDRIETHLLPPRATIERAALDLQSLLTRFDPNDRPAQAAAAAELARLVLGPLAGEIAGPAADAGPTSRKRLAIIPDGALAYVPFGLLSAPGAGAPPRPLLLDREIVVLPSASALATQRQLLAERTARGPIHGRAAPGPDQTTAAPQNGLIAIIADPQLAPVPGVLTAPGSTAASGTTAGATSPSTGHSSLPGTGRAPSPGTNPAPPGALPPSPPSPPTPTTSPGFAPLPGTRREAQAIAALASPHTATLLLGPDARREAILGDRLRGHRFVHFATHGLIDATRPAASGLLLATFDASSNPLPGFLHLRDIHTLRLDAELVFLSGCRTAVGRTVRGEGLAGLSRAFLAAGVPRVLASLWPVDDRATAELAARFYRGLWHEGLAPAAALRQAQLHIRAQRRWQDPYYWGGFVLEGPW